MILKRYRGFWIRMLPCMNSPAVWCCWESSLCRQRGVYEQYPSLNSAAFVAMNSIDAQYEGEAMGVLAAAHEMAMRRQEGLSHEA